MSLYAKFEGDDLTRSAHELRERYLDTGETVSKIFCPGCGVQLVAKCIYHLDHRSVSPHFATFSGSRHSEDCQYASPERKDSKGQSSEYLSRFDATDSDPQVVRHRSAVSFSRGAGEGAPRHKHVTRYLSEVIRSYKVIRQAAIERAAKNGENQGPLIKEMLEAHELDIGAGETLNYASAFRPLYLVGDSVPETPRIYEGIGRVWVKKDGSIVIYALRKQGSREFRVFLRSEFISKDKLVRSDEVLVEFLKRSAKNKALIQWYAYGIPEVRWGNVFVLSPHQLRQVVALDKDAG